MVGQPSGEVTLLFSDIEGSTRLLERLGDARYSAVLERHRLLLREVFGRHRGFEVDTDGDSFFVAFADARSAVASAIDAQRVLDAEDWPDEVSLAVRIGLHSGRPLPVPGDYVGVDVHRAARIMAAAHGGQVLISKSTRELLGDGYPLRDLGDHRLRDLTLPQRLFQVDVGAGDDEFPPIRTLDNRVTNLPVQRTALVGRREELERLRVLLGGADAPIVTVTGPGGTGKTRLAIHVAAELVEEHPSGTFFISLASLRDASLVLPTIARTLGLGEEAAHSAGDTLRAYLSDKRMLLVIDNFEHVTSAAEGVVDACSQAPGVKLLVTSRAPLRLAGEQTFPLAPLAVPETRGLADVARADAVALFVERAVAVRPDFELTEGNASDVAELCSRLDGLPLALELAAARVRVLPPRTILARLNERFDLLTGGSRDADARQQTLRATLDWSHELLTDPERTLLRRISVFKGGCRLDAAEWVCDARGDLQVDLLDGVVALTEQSWLRQREDPDGEPRFWMLESIRSYASELLASSPDAEHVTDAFLETIRRFANEAEPHWRDPDAGDWAVRFGNEIDNIREAVAIARATGRSPLALEILSATTWLWERGFGGEGDVLLGEVYAEAAPAASDDLLARAEFARAIWARMRPDADLDQFRGAVSSCLAVGRRDLAELSRLLLAAQLLARGELAEADRLVRIAEDTATELADEGIRAWAIGLRAAVLGMGGSADEARALLRGEVDRPYYRTNANHLIALLGTLGELDLVQGEPETAIAFAERALSLALETSDGFQLPFAHGLVANVRLVLGELDAAEQHLDAAEEMERRVRPSLDSSSMLDEFAVSRAALSAARGATDDARERCVAAQASLARSALQLTPGAQYLVARYLRSPRDERDTG